MIIRHHKSKALFLSFWPTVRSLHSCMTDPTALETWLGSVVYLGSVYYYRVHTEDRQVLHTAALLD